MILIDINITYLATAKIIPHEAIKISPSAKINSRKIWQKLHAQNLISRKLLYFMYNLINQVKLISCVLYNNNMNIT